MERNSNEEIAALAIVYVAKGFSYVEFPNTYTASYSEDVYVRMNAVPTKVNGVLVQGFPVRFDGKLWDIIAKRIPELRGPFTAESDLIPLAEEILRTSLKEWGTPDLEPSPKNPSGQRTPGWEAIGDPFNP